MFNGARFIRACVDSILAQDTDDFELIVCDDASSDETWTILNSYSYKRLRLIQNADNRGLFPTLNRLMSEATGSLVHLFSSDDRMLRTCLSRTCDFAASRPSVGMIYSQYHRIDANGARKPESGHFDDTPDVVPPLLAAQIMFY